MRRLLISLLTCLMVWSLGLVPAASVTTLPRPPLGQRLPPSVTQVLPDQSVLLVSERCQPLARCPLVTVHHPRDQTPERLLDSGSVRVYLAALLAANYAVLLSWDAGPTSWGSPAAVRQALDSVRVAAGRFAWNGRWYAFGLSMGGVTALNLVLDAPATRSPHGLLLLDARLNLTEAVQDPGRRPEIEAAYGGRPGPERDPLDRLRLRPLPPTLAFSSPDDRTVPETTNTLRLVAEQPAGLVQHLTLTGSHLGGRHFSPELAARAVRFLNSLEVQQARAAAGGRP